MCVSRSLSFLYLTKEEKNKFNEKLMIKKSEEKRKKREEKINRNIKKEKKREDNFTRGGASSLQRSIFRTIEKLKGEKRERKIIDASSFFFWFIFFSFFFMFFFSFFFSASASWVPRAHH